MKEEQTKHEHDDYGNATPSQLPPPTTPTKLSSSVTCLGCGTEFKTRNNLFQHLNETNAACLDPEERQEYLASIPVKKVKTAILYGVRICCVHGDFIMIWFTRFSWSYTRPCDNFHILL